MFVAPLVGRVTNRAIWVVLAMMALLVLVQMVSIAGSDPAASQANAVFPDADGDGVRDEAEADGDTDGDGVDDVGDPDDDGDGILTSAEGPDFENDGFTGDARDTDADGTPDYLDADDDGDGVATANENADPNGDALPSDAADGDGDNQPDFLDSEQVRNTEIDVVTSAARLEVEVADGSRFGTPEAIGDVNGDGVVDLAVGAFSDDGAGEDVGAVWILLMSIDGTVADARRISAGVAGFKGTLVEGGRFGFRVAGVGDLDSDGVPDIAVSAYRSNRVHEDAGEVWVLFLNPDATVKDWQVITEGFGGLTANLRAGDQFGVDVAGIGDLDGDGVGDLAVGMWRRDGLAEDDGGVLIVFLAADGKVKTYQEISAVAGWAGSPVGAGSGFGVSVDSIGDLNKDGVTDLAIGSIGVKKDRGKVWVMTMAPDGTVLDASPITPGSGAVPAVAPGGRFGSSVAGLGDVDGNGNVEIAIGAFGVEEFVGAAWVLELNNTGGVIDSVPIEVEGVDRDDLFGHTLASLGDIDGDGAADLAIGAPGDDTTGEGDGSVYIVQFRAAAVSDEGDASGATPEPAEQPEAKADAADDGGEAAESATDDPEDAEDAEDPKPVQPTVDDGPTGDLDGDGLSNAIEGTGDIDGDGIPNREDLDTDGDGIPDSVEGLADADGDGVADFVEIDDDGDGELTIAEGTGDSDGDGVPDHRDSDSDGDGIGDAVEGGADSDGDGTPDRLDSDSDGDGIDDVVEGEVDSDGDGIPDRLDSDSDGDGIDDVVEGGADSDGDGTPDRLDSDSDDDGIGDVVEGEVDSDGDGIPDRLDSDSDGDGIGDAAEGTDDHDGDGVPNNLDTDSDDDGLSDHDEGAEDLDGDGVPNLLDDDADGDGLLDAIEGAADLDNDGLPDFLDLRRAVAIMDLSVTAPTQLALGEIAEFELLLLNQGPDVASGTTAQMRIPTGLGVNPASMPDGCRLVGRLVTCDVGTLEVAESATRTIRAEVLGEVRQLEVAATVQANEGTGSATTGPLAVFDPATVSQLTDGIRSSKVALIIVALTALLGGSMVIMLTREEALRRSP